MGDITTTQTQPYGPDAPDTDDGKKRSIFGLSLSQTAGSALAAVTTAVAASFLGVAGTLIGAALGSVVSTVAGAAYATSLRTAATRVRATRTVLVRSGPDAVRGASQTDPARIPSGFGAEPVALARTEALVGGEVTTYRSRPRVSWTSVAGVAATGFVLGLGLLSVTEGLIGRPVSGSESSSGTTIGTVLDGSGAQSIPRTPTPTPTPTDPAASPTDGATTGAPDDATTPSAPGGPSAASPDPAAPDPAAPDPATPDPATPDPATPPPTDDGPAGATTPTIPAEAAPDPAVEQPVPLAP